jgi:hypothetical protein
MYHCQYCGRESKKPNLMSLRIHEVRCESNPNRNTNIKTPSRAGKYKGEDASERTKRRKYTKERKEECLSSGEFICQFCEQDIKGSCKLANKYFISLMIHESKCLKNPDATVIRKPCSEETKEKLREKLLGIRFSEERKKQIRAYMKKAVEEHPESYSKSNRNRIKKVKLDGFTLDGSWEVAFYEWAKNNGLNPEKCKKKFPYTWNGDRSYFPDFYIPSLNLYVEIKGYETEQDYAKWSQFPEKLLVLKKKEIEEIKKGTFRGLV